MEGFSKSDVEKMKNQSCSSSDYNIKKAAESITQVKIEINTR